jgi:DNA-binding helix-hairpin-helix protein with protein kinase domain
MPALKRVKERQRFGWPDFISALLVVSWAACLGGAIFGGVYSTHALVGGTIVSLLLSVALVLSKQARARRKTVDDFLATLDTSGEALAQRAQRIEAQHRQRESMFERSNEELKSEIQNYRTADDNLQNVLVRYRESQKADYLRGFLIRDYYRKVPGMTVSHVAMLESFSVESANDIERIKLYGIPSIDGEMVMELLHWRTEVERGYVHKPEHGITLADVGAAKEMAVRKFKISQARKILTAAKQLEPLAETAHADLSRALTRFEQESEAWSNVAKELRDFQSRRRSFERLINQSPARILALTLGVSFVAFLLWLVFG